MIFLQESLWFAARWKNRNGILLCATGAIIPDGSGRLNATRPDGSLPAPQRRRRPSCPFVIQTLDDSMSPEAQWWRLKMGVGRERERKGERESVRCAGPPATLATRGKNVLGHGGWSWERRENQARIYPPSWTLGVNFPCHVKYIM